MAPAMDHRSSIDHRAPSPLPPLGHDISRPSSTSTQASNIMRHFQGQNNINLPGLSALASVASGSPHMRAYTALNGHNLHYSTASPTPTSVGGQGNHPPVCQNCTTSTTPLWRRDELGSVLCNACGLFLKLHGRPRPISLKTDVIKSRNRVKSSSQKKKTLYDANGAPLSRSENGSPSQSLDRRVSQKTSDSDRSNSPLSRATTPAMPVMPQPNRLQLPSILDHHPQHEHSFNHSPPSLPPLNLRQPSPGSFAHAAERQDRPVELLPTYEQLQQANNAHRTRISELEVINDLYRSRVTELESNEQRLRTVEAQLRAALDEAQRGEAHYKKRSYDLEKEISVATQDERPAKRSRLSDVLSPEDAK